MTESDCDRKGGVVLRTTTTVGTKTTTLRGTLRIMMLVVVAMIVKLLFGILGVAALILLIGLIYL